MIKKNNYQSFKKSFQILAHEVLVDSMIQQESKDRTLI